MTYEYNAGEVPVPARQCVRCATPLQQAAAGDAKVTGWFKPSQLRPDTIWIFISRGLPPGQPAERLHCTACGRHYLLAR
ncbi:MAG: hypothetical protein ACKOSS_04010 [Planctomycetia bacterium]